MREIDPTSPIRRRARPQRSRRSRLRAAAGAAAAAAAISALAAACGDSRTRAVSLQTPARPHGFETVRLPAADLRLRAPSDWLILRHERAPLRALITSGSAVVAVWRYASILTPPADRAQLALDRTALLDAARTHGGLLHVYGSALRSVDGAPAVQLDVLERIGQAVRRTLSTHIYLPGAEVVLEEYAPVDQFAAVRREVFSAILRSVRILAGAP